MIKALDNRFYVKFMQLEISLLAEIIEHSENKFVKYFENETVPGVLQSTIQQTYNLQKILTERTESTHGLWKILLIFGNLAVLKFIEPWSRAFQV